MGLGGEGEGGKVVCGASSPEASQCLAWMESLR